MTENRDSWWRGLTTAALLLLVWGFLLSYFRPSLLLLDTMPAGGDTPSFLRPIEHLRDVLLPAGNPMGWDLANFGGYSPYQYYPPLPSLIIVLLSVFMPVTVAFKLMTVSGIFLLPLAVTLTLGSLGFRFPVPALGAAVSLLFLFNPGNSMWGGNIPSTLAGEFSFSLGFALAVLFVGGLYRGIETGQGWRSLGVLLALTGLCHPVPFLHAALAGLFFLGRRRTLIANLRYLTGVWVLAAALMAFWLAPLIAKLGLVTSIPWRWDFARWTEMFPIILLPVILFAVVDLVWLTIRRRAEDRPAHYLLFCALAAQACFINATVLGVPDIRFLPFLHLMLLFLAVDCVRRLLVLEADHWPRRLPLRLAPYVGVLALSLGCVAWTSERATFIRSWIDWNYEGIERKPSYPVLTELMAAVEGSIDDPRVGYEHSPLHNRFGSSRVFENMAVLSGRATLEGVLLQNAVTSPFVYWLQSAVSAQDTRVLPGLSYPRLDLARATPRLDLFNVSDMIVVSPEVRTALEEDPRWSLAFDRPPYAVYHRLGEPRGYVRVPQFQPAMLPTDDWKRDFHRWFGRDEDIEVPLVDASSVPAKSRGAFELATSLEAIPHRPMDADCEIKEQVDHLEIQFTTTCPGLPHWISVAYSPNWSVEGADRVFLSSPAFMLVFPEDDRVRLSFERTAVDWVGLVLTALGLVGLVVLQPRSDGRPFEVPEVLAHHLVRIQPPLLAALLAGVVVLSSWVVVRDFGPPVFYEWGWRAFDAGEYSAAHRRFERVLQLGGPTSRAADAAFFAALSLERQGDPEAALAGFERLVREFPESSWLAESHYRAGMALLAMDRRAEAAARFELVKTGFKGVRWAQAANEELERMNAQDL